jgi:hypothetical protein
MFDSIRNSTGSQAVIGWALNLTEPEPAVLLTAYIILFVFNALSE